jgi:hypothetical protein
MSKLVKLAEELMMWLYHGEYVRKHRFVCLQTVVCGRPVGEAVPIHKVGE